MRAAISLLIAAVIPISMAADGFAQRVIIDGPPATAAQNFERPILGLHVVPLRTRTYRLFGPRTDWGVVVENVIPGSPAEQHGVPRGAIVIGLNGMRIECVEDLMAIMARVPVDRPVELTYVVGGRGYRQLIPLQTVAPRNLTEGDAWEIPANPTPAPAGDLPEDPPALEPPELPEAEPAEIPPLLPEEEPEVRLPTPERAARVPVDADRVAELQAELEELRRRADALESTLNRMRAE